MAGTTPETFVNAANQRNKEQEQLRSGNYSVQPKENEQKVTPTAAAPAETPVQTQPLTMAGIDAYLRRKTAINIAGRNGMAQGGLGGVANSTAVRTLLGA